ncbi:hypothetical protein FO519_008175 [Halicephalobus sp. NKZ332]|nr:hypothetical protein FO519_008175 [Halicephalobus sp. NKZ332]
MDILIDNKTRRVLKFILHTNVPGHYDFGIYVKCDFSIHVPGSNTCIKTDSKLEEFRQIFLTPDEDGGEIIKPVVLNKSSTNGGENPFGSTFCYGRDQLIMEVLDNSYIATVIIYNNQPEVVDEPTEDSLDISD